jgi:Zn-dependent M28 family amino/carboxypeptidase
MDKVQFMLNLDMTGSGGIPNVIALQACPELAGYFGAMAKEMAHKLQPMPRFHPYSDHFAFVMAGVPAGDLGHFGGEPRKGYAHTPADTVDKVVPLELQASSMVVSRLLMRLANDAEFAPEHKGQDEVRALLEDSDFVNGMKFEGRWPWPDEEE